MQQRNWVGEEVGKKIGSPVLSAIVFVSFWGDVWECLHITLKSFVAEGILYAPK